MNRKQGIILASVLGALVLGCIAWLTVSLMEQKRSNEQLEQLAAMDKKEMENEYTQFALQYDELKRSIRNDSLMQRLTEEENTYVFTVLLAEKYISINIIKYFILYTFG